MKIPGFDKAYIVTIRTVPYLLACFSFLDFFVTIIMPRLVHVQVQVLFYQLLIITNSSVSNALNHANYLLGTRSAHTSLKRGLKLVGPSVKRQKLKFSLESRQRETTDKSYHHASSELCLPNDIYIRQTEAKDLRTASKILTDAFFSFNIFSTPLEWLNTFLSLQDALEETSDLYYILVACKASDNSVVGICEIDSRNSSKSDKAPRPYICNLAVDNQWRKKGIGRALIKICEDTAKDGWKEDFLHLRVRRKNKNAIEFYKNLGYMIDESIQPVDKISGDDIILLKKSLSGAR